MSRKAELIFRRKMAADERGVMSEEISESEISEEEREERAKEELLEEGLAEREEQEMEQQEEDGEDNDEEDEDDMAYGAIEDNQAGITKALVLPRKARSRPSALSMPYSEE